MSQDGRAGRPASAGHPDDRDDDSLDLGQIRHYLYAPLRRPLLVVVPWVAILILSIIAFFVLPKRYKSSTLILVESEKVPDKFVQKVATDDRGARLETILPEILSRTRLERVLQETRPYPAIDSRTQAVERLQRAISVNVSGNDGFTIEFVHTDPHKAQEVTNRVATLFMEETMKSREQQVEGAVDFLTTQVADAKKEVEKKDEALRVYKQAHMGALPEQLQTNLATMQMLQQALQNVEESLIFARDKRDSLARGSGIRTPAAAPPAGAAELAELRQKLAALRGRYTDAHPDVQSLRARIARLEARLSTMPAGDGTDAGDPASPVYREQLEQTNNEIKKLETKQADLESRIASVRGHIEETPRTEQELANLTRDYNKLNDNYTALFAKQLEARMAGQLEQRWKGDQFRMLDPANLPEKPYFPKAPLVIGMGLVLGLLVGLAAALVAEYIDSSVKDADDLHSVMTYTVLARIPHFPTLADPPIPVTGAGKVVDASLVDELVFNSGNVVALTQRVPIIESLDDPRSIVGEEFRLLRVKVQTLRQQRAMGCLAMVSALPGEGKSSIAIGLATALAREAGRKVLLMEGDLRRPSISIALGLPPASGLAEWLNGEVEQAHVRRVEPGGFFLLGAGEARLQRPEALGSPRMETLLHAARSEFDTIILDATPVLPVADAVMLQDLVDGFLFVVRSRWTPRAAIQDAMKRLHSDKIIGVVLNDVQEYRHSYMSYAYHGYNMRAGSGSPADRSTTDV